MSETKGKKGTSVAAFLFMPQFNLSLQGFSHIVPIFMRTLALMFAQAGLIPYNHPATRYGIEGVQKYSFGRLMGEAWYSLRTQRSTTTQWGLFLSVMFMIGAFFSAIGAFLLNVVFGIGTAAQAQIFSHPADPYGTGQTNINEGIGDHITTGPQPMFDIRTAYDAGSTPNTNSASADLGLMILDKVLRQSVAGNGSAMQNGLTGLMQVYNTGILVVAAVMIFWMILSIVVDTAKTGVVGGGRHNMVWTPIRVVFALGIMIPLGTTGFSSGQFAVMKLAEWGSNFGTRAWSGYVTGVINSNGLLSPFTAEGASALAVGLTRVKTCQVAWNAEAAKQTTLSALYAVRPQTPMLVFSSGKTRRAYTNATAPNLCGTVEYETAADATATTFAGNTPFYDVITGDGIGQAARAFHESVKGALANDLNDSNGPTGNGALIQPALNFACAFVGREMRPNDAGATNPALNSGLCSNITGCGAGGTSSGHPDTSCHQQIVDSARGSVTSAYNSNMSTLTNYIGGPMITDMQHKGWAGMGIWTYYISVLNDLSLAAGKINVTVIPGTMWGAEDASPLSEASTQEEVVRAITSAYDRWWAQQISDGAAGTQAAVNADPNSSLSRGSFTAIGDEGKTEFKNFLKSSGDPDAFADGVLSRVMPDDSAFFIFDLVEDDGTYPFAELVATGRQILYYFLSIWTILSILQTLSTMSFWGFSAGPGFASSGLVNGILSLSGMGILAGMMLSFYVPVLPLIRTTFAALTWIISVFEAVAMVPIAALAHLTSEGEGIAGGAKTCWILWLNVLLRPVLVVLGFVGSMLVFNTFVVYFHTNFSHGVGALRTDMNILTRLISYVAYTLIYVGAIYTAANSTFKLLDLIPSAMMRWMGGSPDQSFDDNSTAGMLYAASNVMNNFKTNGQPSDKSASSSFSITRKRKDAEEA